MANPQNLIPNSKRTPSELRAMTSKAGKASGESRRQKKTMQEIAKYILTMSIQSGEVHDIEKIQSLADLSGKNVTVDEAIVIKQIEKALKGDINSATFVRDTAGQKPVEQIQNINPPIIQLERPKE